MGQGGRPVQDGVVESQRLAARHPEHMADAVLGQQSREESPAMTARLIHAHDRHLLSCVYEIAWCLPPPAPATGGVNEPMLFATVCRTSSIPMRTLSSSRVMASSKPSAWHSSIAATCRVALPRSLSEPASNSEYPARSPARSGALDTRVTPWLASPQTVACSTKGDSRARCRDHLGRGQLGSAVYCPGCRSVRLRPGDGTARTVGGLAGRLVRQRRPAR